MKRKRRASRSSSYDSYSYGDEDSYDSYSSSYYSKERHYNKKEKSSRDWFEKLFGFVERESGDVSGEFRVTGSTNILKPTNVTLTSKRNGESFKAGKFSVKSLKDLRGRTRSKIGKNSKNCVSHIVIGDVLDMHHKHPNAVFQVASQFNCLEMANPNLSPEDGVTIYKNDNTQGPACAIACAPGTVVRNYFLQFPGSQKGQQRHNQIDTMFHMRDKYRRQDDPSRSAFVFQNGYVFGSSQKDLENVNRNLKPSDDNLFSVGIHSDTQVVFNSRWVLSTRPKTVTQVLCSAIPVAYDKKVSSKTWEPVSRLCLKAAYEATLRTAVLEGKNEIFLTLLGAGVFGNSLRWVVDAINHALDACKNSGLTIYICHYRGISPRVRDSIQEEGTSEASSHKDSHSARRSSSKARRTPSRGRKVVVATSSHKNTKKNKKATPSTKQKRCKSPTCLGKSADVLKVGTRRKGGDGKMWIVEKNSKKGKYWQRMIDRK